MKVRRPDDLTISPKTPPPPSKNRMCQVKELKSTSESSPEPNTTTRKARETMEGSPITGSRIEEMAQKMRVREEMRRRKRVEGGEVIEKFLGGRMVGMALMSEGGYKNKIQFHDANTPKIQVGSEINNH